MEAFAEIMPRTPRILFKLCHFNGHPKHIMSASLRLLATALLSLCLCLPAAAQEPPSASEVQQQLDSLADRKLSEAEQKATGEILQGTLSLLENRDSHLSQLASLKRKLADAPRQINATQQELARLKASEPVDIAKRYASLRVPQLEQLQAERTTQLMLWQKDLSEASSLALNAQTRPERAQANISANQLRTQEINTQLKNAKDSIPPLKPEAKQKLYAELAALDAQSQLLRQELQSNSLLQDLSTGQRDLLTLKISRLEQENQALQSLINDKRRAESEKTVAELAKENQQAGSDNLLSQQSAENLKLSDHLLRTTERLNELTQKNLQTRQQLDSLSQTEQALEEQINVLRGSLLLSRILYQQKQALPTVKADGNLADEIADIRLYQFELNQRRDELSNPEQYLDQLLSGSSENSPEIRASLEDMLKLRADLYERLSYNLNALLNESINLQLNQKQLQTTSQSLRTILDEQMFWIPSNRPLDLAWLKQLPQRLSEQVVSLPWGVVSNDLIKGLGAKPWIFFPVLLVIAVLVWRRNDLKHRLEALDQDIGHYKRDSQRHTPLALLFNLLLALPVSLFLLLAGFALQLDGQGQNVYLGQALAEMALAWLVLYTSFRILKPNGVAERHFHWPQDATNFVYTQIRRLGLLVIPLIAVVTVAEHQPDSLAKDSLGLCVVLLGYALMSIVLAHLLLGAHAREHTSPLRLLLGLAFTLLPLMLIVAIGMGYYYTALKLTDRLIDTLYLLVIWIMAEATFVRGLSVAARRLAYNRAQAKRQSQPKEGAEGGEVVETPTLAIEQINQQSLRLIRLTLFGVFGVALYWVWADLISVITYLDHITLYEYSSGTGDAAVMVPLSLGDLIVALVMVGLTIALASNLPGLLEVLVLSRLSLAQGSAYATTTLLSYVIYGFGFVSTLSVLGVSWDKLQWLVAALSLGIGFGMQEIFANFISGLIILFERPVRIGDTVTIGNLSGTVSRIRIRATTITDFDRKEIIVPNKTFITSQLINWSLSDTVTRVTIKLGVAYGSDLDLVRKLLLQAAGNNPRVLKDPAPIVYFLNFGESTLDHELRIHVNELGDRNMAIDEINRVIEREFTAAGINIAFRQVDVYVKNLENDQVLEHKDVIKAAAAGAADNKTPPPAADPA